MKLRTENLDSSTLDFFFKFDFAKLERVMKRLVFSFFTILMSISISAQFTLIPDPNFEQYLIDLALDTPPIDGKVKTSSISKMSKVSVGGKNITDFTGIEDFESLTYFSAPKSGVIKLDLSKNLKLETFRCHDCKFDSLDFSPHISLKLVECGRCQLEELILPPSQSTANLYIPSNKLKSLDVSNMPYLRNLYCDSNQIEKLDLTKNGLLRDLSANSNNLNELKYHPSGLGILLVFKVLANPNLKCVELTDSATFIHFKNMQFRLDSGATFELNCNYAATAIEGKKDAAPSTFSVFPNPNNGQFTINSDQLVGSELKVLSIDGKIILSKVISQDNFVVTLNQKPGLYYLSISNELIGLRHSKIYIE